MTKKVRESNYELMRVISMFLIVLFHVIHHGDAINHAQIGGVKIALEFILMLTLVHVNSFVLISGYFQVNSKFKLMKVVELFSLRLFYLLIFSGRSLVPVDYTWWDVIKVLLPLPKGEYWFVQCYIYLYLLSPFINKIVNKLSKNKMKVLIIIMILFLSIIPSLFSKVLYKVSGFGVLHFCMMYVIGAYLRKYPFNLEKDVKKKRIQFILCIIAIALLNMILVRGLGKCNFDNEIMNKVVLSLKSYNLAYNNLSIIIASVLYFLFFSTIKLKSLFINKISVLVFGCYLIHDNIFIRKHIYNLLGMDRLLTGSYLYVLYVILLAIIIFIGSLILEGIRHYTFSFIKDSDDYRDINDKVNNIFGDIYSIIKWKG